MIDELDEDDLAALDDSDWIDPDDALEEECVPCAVCSCLIGDEVAYGDTWDGRWVCEGCAGDTTSDGC